MLRKCGYFPVCWNRSVLDMHLLRNMDLLKSGSVAVQKFFLSVWYRETQKYAY